MNVGNCDSAIIVFICRKNNFTSELLIFKRIIKELLDRYGIANFPLSVRLGETSYTDGVDLTAEDIYASVAKTGVLPQTNAISPAEYTDRFTELRKEYDAVVHFTISSKLSSCYQNAVIAAEDVGNVYVVDTKNLSTGMALLAIEAAIMAQKEDADPAQIAETCRGLADKLNVSFILGNLEYMRKGGRCSGVAVFGANLLKLRPELEMKDGSLVVASKYRGALPQVLRQYVLNRLKDKKVRPDRVFFTTTCVDNELPDLGRQVLEETGLFKEILSTTAGCTVTSHCGKDTFGVLFLEE